MQTRERAHCAHSVFPFIKKKKKKNLNLTKPSRLNMNNGSLQPEGNLVSVFDLCDFWHVAKRRSHQAIQRIYISVHQQKLEIKDFIKHLST